MRWKVRRAWGLPPNDPRLADLTDADYLREVALMELDSADLFDPDADDADAIAAREAFDEEIAAAGRGDWDELGLDAPGQATFEPQSIESFVNDQ